MLGCWTTLSGSIASNSCSPLGDVFTHDVAQRKESGCGGRADCGAVM